MKGDLSRFRRPVARGGVTRRRRKRKLRNCIGFRAAAMGGHREWCARCGFERYLYDSCRNRHCPKCQSLAKAKWLSDRQAELLPVPYFHNVFTLPHELNPLFIWSEQNERRLINLLFQAASAALLQFGKNNLGGKIGFTMVLHTWDQQLRPHFHVHALIASLSAQGFITRFLMHILPPGLRRIRHYGYLANRNKAIAIAKCRELLGVRPPKESTARNRC